MDTAQAIMVIRQCAAAVGCTLAQALAGFCECFALTPYQEENLAYMLSHTFAPTEEN
jgi:hypothetical protein